jgi:hypothetical protein
MPIRDPFIERLADMGYPLINVDLAAGQTEATLTAKPDLRLWSNKINGLAFQ